MEIVLITGANGEIGHALIPALVSSKKYEVVALDVSNIDNSLKPFLKEAVKATILDKNILTTLFNKYKFTTVFHLAAILSTGAEKEPEKAQTVNSEGTAFVLSIVNYFSQKEKRTIKFIFPSSIAVYGLPNIEEKQKAGRVSEEKYLNPITIYGITKLYCEMLGKYYAVNYKLLSNTHASLLDFRCVRFPGIISALTLPTGGTSDYAPEMIHAAAKGEGYESFVRPDTKIPFMVMPDAVKALIQLNEAPRDRLKNMVYNVTSFSITADKLAQLVNKVFPDSAISYNPDPQRQKIVDSWPEDIDDSKARNDWGWKPDYDLNRAFSEYLIPEIKNKYKNNP